MGVQNQIETWGVYREAQGPASGKRLQPPEGMDFSETFSPVVKSATIRIVLSLAVIRKWPLRQLEVKNAFLHGLLHEKVFMEQPPGFVNRCHPSHVCYLKRAIYGLKQAPRAWFNRFSQHVLQMGFFCSNQNTVLLLLYVDDIIVKVIIPHSYHIWLKGLGLNLQWRIWDPALFHRNWGYSFQRWNLLISVQICIAPSHKNKHA